jgi:hypothetical protein
MSKSQSRGQTQASATKVAKQPVIAVVGGSPGRITRNSAKSQQAADFEKETQAVSTPGAAEHGREQADTGDDTDVHPALSNVDPDLTTVPQGSTPVPQGSSGVETNETAVEETTLPPRTKRLRTGRAAGSYLDESSSDDEDDGEDEDEDDEDGDKRVFATVKSPQVEGKKIQNLDKGRKIKAVSPLG